MDDRVDYKELVEMHNAFPRLFEPAFMIQERFMIHFCGRSWWRKKVWFNALRLLMHIDGADCHELGVGDGECMESTGALIDPFFNAEYNSYCIRVWLTECVWGRGLRHTIRYFSPPSSFCAIFLRKIFYSYIDPLTTSKSTAQTEIEAARLESTSWCKTEEKQRAGSRGERAAPRQKDQERYGTLALLLLSVETRLVWSQPHGRFDIHCIFPSS